MTEAATTLALVAALGLSGCDATCPAIGYANIGPIEIVFTDPVPEGAIVLACLGEDCEPAEVPEDGGGWSVPQEPPYVDEASYVIGGADLPLRVVVQDRDGAVVHDEAHTVPVVSERAGIFGQCPGPFRYEPVEVDLGR